MATGGSVSTYDGPLETLTAHVRKEFTAVYTPGMACNLWFAAAVYAECSSRVSMYMLGPRYFNNLECCDKPDRILHSMRCCDVAGSQGGWIHVTPQVMASLHCCLDRSRVIGAALHQQLPFWRDMSFIDYIDPAALVRLVSAIKDPRWFLTQEDTTGYQKLGLYLGLTPHNMAAAMGDSHSTPQIRRCNAALRVWQREGTPPVTGNLLPSQFLWRVWRKHENPVIANLRTTQAFVRYLVRVWHKRLFAAGHPHADLLFNPKEYFADAPVTATAYAQHMTAPR